MPKCILISFFNSNNIGDVLIANLLYKDISECGLEVEKCSYGGSFEIVSRAKEKKVYKQSDGKNINTLTAVNYLARRIEKKIRKILFWLRFNMRVKKCDLLILGGGNMIMDLSAQSKSWLKFKNYVDVAKKYHKKVVVLSIGVGPFQIVEQENKAIEVLNSCDYVTYRDEKSYNIGSINTTRNKHFLSLDPVFMLPKKASKPEIINKRTIGICVINTLLFDSSIDRYNHTLLSFVELANSLASKSYDVVVFSTEYNDYKMVEDVVKRCDDDRIYRKDIQTYQELLDLYSNKLSFLIGARMHSLIIAFTQHMPFIGLSWQQKINSMFEIIDSSKDCFPIDNIRDNIDNILLAVDKGNSIDPYMQNRINKLEVIKQRYEANRKVLKSLKNNFK